MSPLLIALALVQAASPQAKSLLDQKGMTYTGRNGYEEYLMAADVINGGGFGTYFNMCSAYSHRAWEVPEPDTAGGSTKTAAPAGQPSELFQRLLKMTPLEVKRETVAKFGKALELIAAGNRKTVTINNEGWDTMSTFPELAKFKDLVKLASIKADVCVADGDTGSAVSVWRDALEFGDRIGRGGTMIHSLVAIATRSIVLASVEKHMGALSVRDWPRLESQAKDLLKREPLLVPGIQGERSVWGNHSVMEIASAYLASDELEDSDRKDLEAMQKMRGSEAEAFLAEVKRISDARCASVLSLLKQAEAFWVNQPKEDCATLASRMATMLAPVFAQPLSAEAKSRTQLRLLRLHCLIEKYRHEWGELPETLEGFPADALRDPAANDVFQYAKRPGGYELASKGWKDVGRIHLRYVWPRSTGGPEGGPPPQ